MDPVDMASDGNRAVKIKQSCPQCRSDLSQVLEKTLYDRRAFVSKRMKSMKDSDLNATELRMKYMFVTDERNDHDDDDTNNKNEKGSKVNKSLKSYVDTALYAGLEYFMTESEQSFVSQLMTSGDVDRVAQAAQILESIAVMSRNGRKPVTSAVMPDSPYRSRISSSNRRRPTSRAEMTTSRALAMTHSAEQQEEEERQAAILAHRKRYPLPVRMPRCVTFSTDKFDKKHGYGLFVLDDEWDGSISDAFRRVCVTKGKVTHSNKLQGRDGQSAEIVQDMLKKHKKSKSKRNHLYNDLKKRVIVSKVKAQAGLNGIQKGDVITHINGEAFGGDANELEKTLSLFVQGDSFTIVVNAEPAVAESLHLRSLC